VPTDIYQRITDQIITALETGVPPWHKPWNASNAAGRITLPLRSSGIPYQGINTLLLWCEAMAKGYQSPSWLTFKQSQALGGMVRKGEHGSMVVYADRFTKKDEGVNGEEVEKTIPFLKAYTVFNAEQVDGLPDQFYATPAPVRDPVERDHAAEAFFRATGADIRYGGNKCFYVPSADFVQMAPYESFADPVRFYGVLSHEVVGHWTGHPSRLNRDLCGKFRTQAYAFEEMVAEIAAAMTCAELGLEPVVDGQHAAYIATWIKLLKDHPKAIVSAASMAQKSVEYAKSLQPGYARQPAVQP
jgi:antirestriction protein ArdC